jgi:hypothetical protein
LIFKGQYSSTKQKETKHHKKKKRKVVLEDSEQNTETTIAVDDKETNHFSQKIRNQKIKLKNNISQKLDELHLNFHPDEINTDTINDIHTGAGPVMSYADEPLLPLVKACAPLINIVHDLATYVQLSLHETPEQPSDGLTIDESAAIRLYTIEWKAPHRSLYSMLNHTLKTGTRQELRPYFRYLKLLLTALIKLPCVEPLTIWRGVTKDMSAEFPPGTLVTWWSFSSCTTSLTVLENNMYLGNTGERTLFSVDVINGRTIRNHSHFVTEDEILLLPGTHMIVQSQLSPAPELHIIHLKQITPIETLLEPPFEGIILNYLF